MVARQRVASVERILVRAARADECRNIARLESSFFPYAGLSVAQVSSYRRKAPGLVLVAAGSDRRVFGYIICSITRYGGTPQLHIVSMGVIPSRRRRGLGRRLLRAAFRRGRQAGAMWASLEVSTRNRAAIGMYRSLGFETTRRRPDYYEPGHDAHVMIRPLG